MKKIMKFGSGELSFVLINSSIAKMFLIFPSQLFGLVSSASVLMAVILSLIGLLAWWLSVKLYEKNPMIIKNKIVLSLLLIMFISIVGLMMRCWAESIKLTVMPKSPYLYIFIFFIVAIFISAYIGIKSIVRMHSLLVPVILLSVFLLFLGNIKNFNYTNVFPILGTDIKSLFKATIYISYISDMAVIYFLMPHAHKKEDFRKLTFKSWAVSSAVMIIIALMYVCVINRNISGELNLPIYRLARSLRAGENSAHFESIFSISCFLSFLLCGSLYLYVSAKICKDIFEKDCFNAYIVVLTFIIVIICAMPSDTQQLVYYMNLNSMYKVFAGMFAPWFLLTFGKKESK